MSCGSFRMNLFGAFHGILIFQYIPFQRSDANGDPVLPPSVQKFRGKGIRFRHCLPDQPFIGLPGFLLGIRPQTLGEMLQKLEERGLVARKKSEADARAIEVTLTDEGRARAAEIAERRALAAADLFAVLTDEEKDQLASILDKLGTELEKYRPKRHCKHAGETETVQA